MTIKIAGPETAAATKELLIACGQDPGDDALFAVIVRRVDQGAPAGSVCLMTNATSPDGLISLLEAVVAGLQTHSRVIQ